MCAKICPAFSYEEVDPRDMPSVISLKELRDSSTLKDQIRKLEEDREELQKQLEFQKKLEAKLREDILSQKKDFEHLEKQFDHFAGMEAQFEALQTEVQLERLEAMVNKEKEEARFKAQVKKAKDDMKGLQDELKELKQLDPQRLKRQVSDLKKKTQTQADENKAVNKALISARKELKEVSAEKDKLSGELNAAREGKDFFWQSKDGLWSLFESAVVLKHEAVDSGTAVQRVRCFNTESGASALSVSLGDDGLATWSTELEVPSDVSKEAGNRLKKFAAEAEEAAKGK